MEEGKQEERHEEVEEEMADNEWGDWRSHTGVVSSNCPFVVVDSYHRSILKCKTLAFQEVSRFERFIILLTTLILYSVKLMEQ